MRAALASKGFGTRKVVTENGMLSGRDGSFAGWCCAVNQRETPARPSPTFHHVLWHRQGALRLCLGFSRG